MITKMYYAEDLTVALAQMRLELGPEAVILHQRQLPPARWWPFGRRRWEILAADESAGDEGDESGAAGGRIARLESEIAALRATTARLITVADLARLPRASLALADCYEWLNARGVSAELAQELVLAARDELSPAAQKDLMLVQAAARRQLEGRIRTRAPQVVKGKGPLVVFLVGQTGVGKTTALLKLAAQQALDGRRVALINTDTTRPAAGAQIESLAAAHGLAVETVRDPAGFDEALARHAGEAAIFVDTPGAGHNDTVQLGQLAAFMRLAPRRQAFLVLTCSTPLDEMEQIVAGYRTLGLNGLILSKADETASLGIALTFACRSETPAAYFTTGRRIPEDLQVASPAALSAALFGMPGPALRSLSGPVPALHTAPAPRPPRRARPAGAETNHAEASEVVAQ